MKRLVIAFVIMMMASIAFAQSTDTTTTTTTSTNPSENTIEYFFTVCDDAAIVSVKGYMYEGWDIFFQVFSNAQGAGDTLTSLRRANVDGEYEWSERTTFRDGKQVAPGQVASARIIIAPTDDPATPAYTQLVDDLNDGCSAALYSLQNSDDAGDPVTLGSGAALADGEIANPDGGLLNPVIEITPDPVVVLGPRIATEITRARTANPGLIFAQCDSFYPEALPGLLYDTDDFRIYWYWYAATPELLEDNLSKTVYSIGINNASVPAHDITVGSTLERDGVFYRFFTIHAGHLREGHYEVEFKQDWTEPINDGFQDYGIGTDVPNVRANCNFDVRRNPLGINVPVSGMYIGSPGLWHDYGAAIEERELIESYLESLENSTVGQSGN